MPDTVHACFNDHYVHFLLLFDLGFIACQDFTHFEPSQSEGGTKTGEP